MKAVQLGLTLFLMLGISLSFQNCAKPLENASLQDLGSGVGPNGGLSQPLQVVNALSDQTLIAGSNFSATVTVSGNVAKYEWFWNTSTSPIAGANSNTLSISSIKKNQAGVYRVVATGTDGSVVQSAMTLVVNDPPASLDPVVITTGLNNQSLQAGSTLSLSIAVTGDVANISFSKVGVGVLQSGSQSSYTKVNLSEADSGMYQADVTGLDGSTASSSMTLMVTSGSPQPQSVSITSGLVPQTVTAGSSVVLSVTASGDVDRYEWFFDKAISGSPSLTTSVSNVTLSNMTVAQSGNYGVRVVGENGSTATSNATITVNPAPPEYDPVQIISDLTNQTVIEGAHVTLSVGVTGDVDRYEWWFGPISGSPDMITTVNGILLYAVDEADEMEYHVKVYGLDGTSVDQSSMTLTVNPSPQILQFQSECTSSNGTFVDLPGRKECVWQGTGTGLEKAATINLPVKTGNNVLSTQPVRSYGTRSLPRNPNVNVTPDAYWYDASTDTNIPYVDIWTTKEENAQAICDVVFTSAAVQVQVTEDNVGSVESGFYLFNSANLRSRAERGIPDDDLTTEFSKILGGSHNDVFIDIKTPDICTFPDADTNGVADNLQSEGDWCRLITKTTCRFNE
ncbi:MAG: hypothetical protein R2827_07410 [Bdellovibrionales bacterium]